MTISDIFTKLRKFNRGKYKQLLFCVTFAVFLITSFAATLYSQTVQSVLPVGGDSRKQVEMIFVISLIGCLFFAIYATGLFFKYKSKETGVFLALGTPKRVLAKTLYIEMIKIILVCTFVGLILGSIASLGIWQIFRVFLVDTKQMRYLFSPKGLGVGFLFGLAVSFCILFMTARFMKRSNLMDIMNEQRKNEPITEVTGAYGITGIVMLIAGLFLGYLVPSIMANNFNKRMPGIWSAVYLIALLGAYRLITYEVSHHARGRNPQKYYKNIIPFSMMKSQGRQTVRNMLVITFLVGASIFALFYVPMLSQVLMTNGDNPVDFALAYEMNIYEVGKEDIYTIAEEYNTQITMYKEVVFAKLIGSGIERDWADSGDLTEDYYEKYKFFEFISESDFNEATGKDIEIKDGSYLLITFPDTREGFWSKYNDLDKITNSETENSINVAFAGTVDAQELSRDRLNRYVISDSDFKEITQKLSENKQMKQILFNVSDVQDSYPFAEALYDEFVNRAPAEMARMNAYDEYQEELALSKNETYYYSTPMDLSPDNPDLMDDWKYYPTIKILIEKTLFRNMAVYFLLFIYVAIICLAAVGIIAYTRSVTIGINNKQLFDDLGKLGANHKYVKKCITSQLTKIFVLPVAIGSSLILIFMLIILVGNDGLFSRPDMITLSIDLAITIVVFIYLYIVYRFSLKKISGIVGIR